MRLSRVVVLIALLLAPATALAGASVKMGVLPVLDTLPLHVAVREGLFAAKGLDVELVPFASALERDAALQAGQHDGYFGDMVNTLMLIRAGVPMRIITVAQRTRPGQRMFGVAAAPARKDLAPAGLAGASVGISQSTVIEYLLDAMEARAGLAPGAMKRVDIKKIPLRVQMLLAGELDSALLPEPLLSLAASKGARVILTDEDLNLPLTVVCLREKLAADPTVRKAFLAAYAEALARIAAKPEAYRALMAEVCRIPPELAGTYPVCAFPAPALPSPADVESVGVWMTAKGLLPAPLAFKDVTVGD